MKNEENSKKEIHLNKDKIVKLNLSKSCKIPSVTLIRRRNNAYRIRVNAASFQKKLPVFEHKCNGDEELYFKKIGNFSKALPHNKIGEVDLSAYKAWIMALTTSNSRCFENIPLGGPVKLANPQASYAYNMIGADSHYFNMAMSPAFNSAEIAGEMAENYWLALTRDIPFSEYDNSIAINAAAKDLSSFSDFKGPKENCKVTPKTIFRGNTADDLVAPYISQFFYQNIPFGAKTIKQKYRISIEKDDYMTSYHEWLHIQNGGSPKLKNNYDTVQRYIVTGRDLSEWVHQDFTYQGFLSACLIILSYGKDALAENNPYLGSKTQGGFITFGAAHILDLVSKAAKIALESAWFQKFLVHRKLRPEEFGGRVHIHMNKQANYDINSELLNSRAVTKIYSKYGTYLLPMAYPEGCPTHPAYPAGHASIAGACATILKAFFKNDFILTNPVYPSNDGLSLLSYKDSALTLGGELNKLASNIALGRDTAGVHWRSDGIEGLKLGEEVAISILQDYRDCYNEDFIGFSFRKFDGTLVII
jgi:hypothetical protein